MTDLELFFVVLGVIYLWECCWWARRGAVGFRRWIGKTWSLAEPSRIMGTQNAGLVLAAPLPPLGTLITAQSFPLWLSPEAVMVSLEAGSSVRRGSAGATTALSFDEVSKVEARERKIQINGKIFFKASSPGLAAHLAFIIEQVRVAKRAERRAIIERELASALDTKAIRRRWDECNEELRGLSFSTNFLFIYIFGLVPLMVWRVGLSRGWPWILAGLLTCTFTIAIHYYQTHKKLYPAGEDERFTHFIILLLSPASAVRARDLLTRPVLASYHPLAVANVFCEEKTFLKLAARSLREAAYPGPKLNRSGDELEVATESFARDLNKEQLEVFLRNHGHTREKLLRPPMAADASCVSYCPRCLAQFTKSEGQCSDCGGVELIALDETPKSQRQGTRPSKKRPS